MRFYKLRHLIRLFNHTADVCLLILALLFKIFSFDYKFFSDKAMESQRVLAILGNGPSLKHDLAEIDELKSQIDFCAVNNFANTELFLDFKPSTYVIVDPVFGEQTSIRILPRATSYCLVI